MDARNRSLPDWLTKVRTHQLVLPRFQRMEAWGYQGVKDLLQTVVDGLPAGATLTLDVGDKLPFVSRPVRGAPETGERTAELLLDGQQRVTALWRSLNDDYPNRTYFVVVPENQSERPLIDPVARWVRDGHRFPLWADSPQEAWSRRHVPVRLLRPDDRAETELWNWAHEAVKGNPAEENELLRLLIPLRGKFAGFNLPYLALPVGTDPAVALHVFIKMNTQTVPLSAFDIVVAQVEEAAGESLHDLVEGLEGAAPGLSAYISPPEFALSVSALMQGRAPSETGYLGLDFRRMVEEWRLLVEGARQTVLFLQQERVFDAQRLPTISVLGPLAALWSFVTNQPDARGNAQILFRKYLWRSFFTERYERAAATAALQDYRALKDLLLGVGSEADVPCFNGAAFPLPDREILMQASWPRTRDRLARAILLLSLRGGAYDFADGTEATREHLAHREYHHLYPVALLGAGEYEEGEADRALNCALVTWKTNRTISAKEPLTYLLERAEASLLNEPEVRRRLASHALSYDDLASGDYRKFLANRAEQLAPGVEALCRGEPWFPAIPR